MSTSAVNADSSERQGRGAAPPDLSLVMPCYNEEECVGVTIRRLVAAFDESGYRLELVAVDNGSRDHTGELIRQLAGDHAGVRYHRVEVNQGYGHGLMSGIPLCAAPWIGFISADGQVDPADVVHLYEAAAASHGNVVAKVRRRFRMDGFQRKLVSIAYNLLVRMMWPRLDSLDVNGTPKILPRNALLAMKLQSKGWFLDPEIMIKAHYMGLRVLEFNAFARMRSRGVSHVRAETCWEFLRNLLVYRFSRRVTQWRREVAEVPVYAGEGGR